MYIISVLRLLLCMVLAFILMIYYYLSLLVRRHKQEKAFNLRRNWVIMIMWVLGIRIDISGEIPKGPALFVSNHRSMMDALILTRYIYAYIIAKAEVSRYPLIGLGAKITGVIFVKREKKKSRKNTRQTIVETLKSGKNVLIFPEGTTGIRRSTLSFKIGSYEELAKLGLPVVPMAIEYKNRSDLWRNPNMAFQLIKQFAKWRTHVKVRIGTPLISTDAMELHDKSKACINDELRDIQKGWHEVFG